MKRLNAFARVCFPFAMLVLLLGVSASGAVITFAPLPGPSDAAYAGHVEAGFTVTPTLGDWFQALLYGNPIPSIYDGPVGSPGTAALEVTDTSLPFVFSSLDYSSNNGTSEYLIQGFLGAAMVFSEAGVLVASLPPGFGFTTLASANPGTLIDRLVIQVTPGGGVTSINLDNIDVTKVAIPEPGTFLLLGAGLCSVLLLRRAKLKRS